MFTKEDTMGQCVSKKAAMALGQHRANMRKHHTFHQSPEVEEKIVPSKQGETVGRTGIRGISSSTFGFKKRNNATSGGAIVSANSNAAKRLANSNQTADNDPNGNNDLVDEDHRAPLTSNIVPSGRTTPRIPPPKKEQNATRQVSRFGFRQPPGSRYKVADINETTRPTYMDNEVGNTYDNRAMQVVGTLDTNRNRGTPGDNGKFMLQATQLPKPVPVRIMDTKTAKTLANNNRKISRLNPSSDESSKDGSSYLTEDSGIGSLRYEKLNGSPKFGSNYRPRRTLNMVVTGNKFDVHDSDLPDNIPLRPSTSGGTSRFVHKRALEYERNLERDHRKISVTSSEVSTSDYAEEEFVANKNMFLKPNVTPKWFLKPKLPTDESSPPTSDDQMWTNGGEAMAVAGAADDFKCGFSSSDESKDNAESFNRKEKERNRNRKSSITVSAALDNLLASSKTHTLHKYDVKQVLLTIEDPSYAAVRQYNSLLSEEPSPDENPFNTLSISEKDDMFLNRTLTATSPINLVDNTPLTEDKSLPSNDKAPLSDSNDKQEQQQPTSSPGTPTNGSNSMSLSEGRDFLIDDEIADQPALLIDDTITNNTTSETATTSMASEMTLVDATPKSRSRVTTDGWMESPLVSRRKQSSRLRSRAGSLDTLSPCESIASDDFMMDYSMSSGIDDANDTRSERNSRAFLNDDGTLRGLDLTKNDLLRDWSSLLSSESVKSPRRTVPKIESTKPNSSVTVTLSGRTVNLQVPSANTAESLKCTKPENNTPNCISIANVASADSPASCSSSSSGVITDGRGVINRNRTGGNQSKCGNDTLDRRKPLITNGSSRKRVSNDGVILVKPSVSAGSQSRPMMRNGTASLTTTPSRPMPTTASTRLLRSRATTPNNSHQLTPTRCSLDTLQYAPRPIGRLHQQHNLPRGSLPASSTSSSAHNSHTSLHLLRGAGNGTTRSSSSSMAGGYDSDESAASLRLERSVQSGMIQDAMALKTMLFRLKRVLQENMDEDILLRSETHNPFDPASLSLATLQHLYATVPVTSSAPATITNGHVFGNTCLNNTTHSDNLPPLSSVVEEQRLELADLRRQVLYQQGQLEDRDKEVQKLREDMAKLMRVYENGGGGSLVVANGAGGRGEVEKSIAATQTDRIRPISCGPAILDGTATGNGSLVSSTEVTSTTPTTLTSRIGNKPHLPVTPRTNYNATSTDSTPTTRSSSRPLLRHGGGSRLSAPSPHRCVIPSSSAAAIVTTPVMPVVASSIPRRSCSRSRT